MTNWGYSEETARKFGTPLGEWTNNILSSDACLGPSGRIGRATEVKANPHDQDDVDKICALLGELKPLLEGLSAGELGSEGTDPLGGYWVAASDDWWETRMTPDTVRALFGTTLYPEAEVHVLPIRAWFDPWLEEVMSPGREDLGKRWTSMVGWFDRKQAEGVFQRVAYVDIRHDQSGPGHTGGSCMPRLWMGQLASGSVCGAATNVVWT